ALTPISTNVAQANANLGATNVRRTTPTVQKPRDGDQELPVPEPSLVPTEPEIIPTQLEIATSETEISTSEIPIATEEVPLSTSEKKIDPNPTWIDNINIGGELYSCQVTITQCKPSQPPQPEQPAPQVQGQTGILNVNEAEQLNVLEQQE
ncbi:MAG TPA: hypothetical protein VJC00_03835, partial [Candidatus Nanoarchaeia archaeon]|nr:hypothetical protein [Candidatus Nanoarchaeia archaeon]